MAEHDPDYVARLRVALARIARGLDRQSRGESYGPSYGPQHGSTLTRTQASVLGTAARRGPLRVTELAEIEGVNPTMLSRIVGKLEEARLLVRRADPDDRRAALIEPTAEGRCLHERLRDERTRLLAEHLSALPPEHADELLAALPAIEALAHALVPAQAPPDRSQAPRQEDTA